jgi:hypothetical protein
MLHPSPLSLHPPPHPAPSASRPPPSPALGGPTASVDSPFAIDGLQPALAVRDQRIALLEFKLRCATTDADNLRAALDEANRAIAGAAVAGGEGGAATPAMGARAAAAAAAAVAASAAPSHGLASDEDGAAISVSERRTLNALVRR